MPDEIIIEDSCSERIKELQIALSFIDQDKKDMFLKGLTSSYWFSQFIF